MPLPSSDTVAMPVPTDLWFAVTFSGHTSITVPPGAPLVSDPVDLAVPQLGNLAVSLYVPEISPATTWHFDACQTAYINDAGDVSGAVDFKPSQTFTSRIFLSEILVDAAPDARAVVTFGDSITDGNSSSLDANHRWPDVLAERLAKAAVHVAIVNEGISGARVLRDSMGDTA